VIAEPGDNDPEPCRCLDHLHSLRDFDFTSVDLQLGHRLLTHGILEEWNTGIMKLKPENWNVGRLEDWVKAL
jgi:hypothetical protein